MINRPFYTRKYHSGRLKEFGYTIENTFDESKSLNDIIALSDNQFLRTLRDIRKHTVNKEKLELLIKLRDFNKKKLVSPKTKKGHQSYSDEVKRLQDKINRTLFNPDYVTVVIDTPKQYEYLFYNGFTINGEKYKRLSCSAGQARVSTVVFVNENIYEELMKRLNNGRNTELLLSPSKFNAYFGLYSSATTTVSEPRFIVVKDYKNTTSFMANYVVENGKNVDDTIIQKEIKDTVMNRTDGMGLISYRQAKQWAEELDLDYVPSQFCIRQSFMKGMLCVFPIHEFCEEINGGNYMVDTIYKDSDGNYIKADLRDYDVIITESQFKLWDSYDSLEAYIENCRKNNLQWGISLVSPKEAKKMLKLNYQFIQTLRLNSEDIKKLCSQFVEWISGVSYENVYYTLLFLLGVNNDTSKINNFLSGSDSYWIKSLVANHTVKNDKYVRTKIRTLIKNKIANACKGDIYIDGNFQVIVSDPYGFMQHVCGLPVTGLLKPGKSYSNYWNNLGISKVDAMRSPLTYMSEHVILDLQKDDETEKWYRYCNLGIILNFHGHETFNFAGSDFDMDILATTPNEIMLKGVQSQELPVVYDAPKPIKMNITDEHLYKADTFSFGSIIGSITNKSSIGYAKLPIVTEKFGEDSAEYRLLKSRLMQCCKAQSAQIDKAKIGQDVKGIPKVWINKNKITQNKTGKITDKHANRKNLYNNTLLDKYPYFFRYVYKETDKEYKKYLDEYDIVSKQKYRMPFSELEQLENKTDDQKLFIDNFYKYCPVIISDNPMNILCKYIEEVNFNISKKIKSNENLFDYNIYKCNHLNYLSFYESVKNIINTYIKNQRLSNIATITNTDYDENSLPDNELQFNAGISSLKSALSTIHSNPYIITNCLVDYFYQEKPGCNKDILWKAYGKYIYRNVVNNSGNTTALFPIPCSECEVDTPNKELINYLGYNYKLQEVQP